MFMKNIFSKSISLLILNLTILVCYSQVDEEKKTINSFEDYKKSEESKFKSFKEKRAQEIKEFISNEENWNLITIESKGNVSGNIDEISKSDIKKTVVKIEKEVKPNIKEIEVKVPDYVNTEKKKTQKENISYDHPLKNSKFRLSSPFGFRIHPIYKTKRFHSGLDYAASKGIPIYSITDGTVIRAGFTRGYGNYIVIEHRNGLKSAYAHMSTMNVKNGDKVIKGEKIGGVGMTGSATGNHLHFEVIRNNKKVNPKLYVSQ